MFSDRDIRKALHNEIVIYPFKEDDVTPMGYNLNPSDFVFSLKSKRVLPAVNGYYRIQPHDVVLILTEEAIWLSNKVAGTLQSKVGLVSRGFGHISTAVDPMWQGPLLIALHNLTDHELELPTEASIARIVFYRLQTSAQKSHDNKTSRLGKLNGISEKAIENKLIENGNLFLEKAQGMFGADDTYQRFTQKYTFLSQRAKESIVAGQKNSRASNRKCTRRYWLWMAIQVNILMAIAVKFCIMERGGPLASMSRYKEIYWLDENMTAGFVVALAAISLAIIPLMASEKRNCDVRSLTEWIAIWYERGKNKVTKWVLKNLYEQPRKNRNGG